MGDWWFQRGGGCFIYDLHVIMCNVEVISMIKFLELMVSKGNESGIYIMGCEGSNNMF